MTKRDQHYTYADYASWPEDERWELINGVAYDMSPAPSNDHQKVQIRLSTWLYTFFEDKPCEVRSAPFDVFFPAAFDLPLNEVDTVVEPDVVVMCGSHGSIPQGYRGAPELVAEILSPRTAQKDLREKFALYEREGVREFWVVDPASHYVRIFTLTDEGAYDEGDLVTETGTANSRIFEGFSVDLAKLFEGLFSSRGAG